MSAAAVKLRWRQGNYAPEAVTSFSGSAVAHHNTAYFSHDNYVYSYTTLHNTWRKLKRCEYRWFSMAVVNNKLTTIGGWNRAVKTTNSLLCLTGSYLSEMKWEESLPPMPTKRVRPAAVTTPTHLLVAGGRKAWWGGGLSTVEILTLSTLQWASACTSPMKMEFANITLSRELLYLSQHDKIFSCSLEDLLTSTTNSGSVWTRLPNIPVRYWASLATLRGRVLAVGGSGEHLLRSDTQTRVVHIYNRSTNRWSVIGEMPTARCNALVAVLASNELVVVGGSVIASDLSCCEVAHLAIHCMLVL